MATMIGLGEALWDLFADGRALGGAPANFAYHCAQLGHQAHVISRVGRDSLGDEMLAALRARGVSVDWVQRDGLHGTGTVPVEVAPDGAATFRVVPDVAWDYLAEQERLHGAIASADVVCFGTLAQRSTASRRTIHALLESCRRTVIFDANLRHRLWSAELVTSSLRPATVAKVNESEWLRLVSLGLVDQLDDPVSGCRRLIDRFALRLCCITRGSRGCLLVSADEWCEHPGFSVSVVDTVGCGDAVAAALAHGLVAGMALDELARFADQLGAWVASQRSATPSHPDRWPT